MVEIANVAATLPARAGRSTRVRRPEDTVTAPTDGRGDPPDAPDDDGSSAFETAESDLLGTIGHEVRSRFVDLETPRTRVHAFETGAADGEPPLVFVHGTAQFGAFLAPLMARLDDVRVIGFDRPGYGRSDPFVYTAATLRETLVDGLESLLDGLGLERVDLVGHSMGGHACVLFALAHPDRVGRIVALGATPGLPGTHPPRPLRLLTAPLLGRVLRRLQKPDEEGVRRIAAVFGERETIGDHPKLVRAIAAHEADPASARAGASEFAALMSLRGWRPAARLHEAELRRLRHPTTLVWGEHDPLGGPGDVREAVAWIPDARFETVEAGHIPYLAHPERCARLIREARATDPGTGTGE